MSTEDTDPKARRRRAIQWLRRGKRGYDAYNWYGRLDWLLSLFKTKAELALFAGSTAVVGGVAALTTVDAVQSTLRVEPPAVVERERTTQSSTVFTIEGFDKAQRRALFDVVVAKKELLWVRGSSDALEKDGRPLEGDAIAAQVFDAEVAAALAGARGIIAVGTASQEGNAAEEVLRAGRRSETAARLAMTAVPDTVPVWSLNLGQYREPCATCETGGTSWQRPFIVVAVKEGQDGVELGEALADAMTGKEKLPSPASYSVYELRRVR